MNLPDRQPSSKGKKERKLDLNLSTTSLSPSLSLSHTHTPHAQITTNQVADWEPKIRKIVSWFDQLQAVDLEAEEEKERLAEEQGGAQEEAGAELEKKKAFSLRADEVSQFGGDPADALREAPEKEGECLKVPRIM